MRRSSSSSTPTTTTTCRTSCCSNKAGIKRGPWTPEEDEILAEYITREGVGRWRTLPARAGLLRCGKSCRLRWMNYLRPSVKRGRIAADEEDLILRLHRLLGNRWALIAGRIPGRTDNEIKNYWNTHLSKKLIKEGIDPRTHKPLNPNLKDNNPNSSSSNALPAYTPNPNQSSGICVPFESISQSFDQTLPGMTNIEEIIDKGRSSDNSLISSDALLITNNPNNFALDREFNNYEMMTSYDHAITHRREEESSFGGIDYYDDNTFSSILNSLIDEDVFGNQQF